ncbi:hypothetical protein FXV91_05540 [Methanosarcina sp. DH2]|uniref:hypothetical protein n=1 Tax=Methanosarcina sp. DH2 TaxID=2605639 RepID=UPI001E2E6577|nr:hypothetical protein [Methanosarcina sp. DH2]MCC4769679.1 hypothetical protein [Methanosarcina sp. DH2]
MIGNLVADVSHVTIPAIQRRAIENLLQADETLAASVEPKGVRGYIEIKKATPSNSLFFIAESPIDCFHFGFWIA